MTPIRLFFVMLFAWASFASGAAAQDLRPQFLLTGADSRTSQSLTGQWTYSKDLYR